MSKGEENIEVYDQTLNKYTFKLQEGTTKEDYRERAVTSTRDRTRVCESIR